MEKTKGIVIKCKDYSETSQLVWLFTRDFGKIKIIAKGSRTSIKKFKGKLDLFNLCEIVFYKSARSELHTVSECEVIEPFSKIRQDLHRLAVASYISELLEVSAALEDPSKEIYSLAEDVFKWLNEGKNPNFIRFYFEIKLSHFSGNLPKLDNITKGVAKILESKSVDKLRASPKQLEELRDLSRLVIDYSVDKRLKSLEFLEEVERR